MKPWQNEKQITAYIEQFNFTRREAKGFILADCLEGFESLSHLHAWNFVLILSKLYCMNMLDIMQKFCI